MKISIPEGLFLISVSGIVYHYAGYPLLLFFLSTLVRAKSDLMYLINRRSRRTRVTSDRLPRVALLMSAYNEASVIQAKVKNCLQIDYPADCLEFLFGLDAPSDSTGELLKQMQPDRVQVFAFSERRGKLQVLGDLAQRTTADILVFTDANTMLEPNCVRNMARHFADPAVGAVSGEELRRTAEGTDPGAESIYWRYESAVKILESRVNCSLGGNGAALAVRREFCQPRQQSIVEDFQIPLEIRYKGFRVVYDPEAIAIEEITPAFSAQFARRVRIGAGNYEVLLRHPEYLDPRKGLLTFCFASHRLLRWVVPFLLLTAFFSSLGIAMRDEFGALFILQSVFYSMALAGYWLKKQGKRTHMFSLPFHFCSMNLALVRGLIMYLRGSQGLVWDSTPRQTQAGFGIENLFE